ncbi:hypothetical protein GDO86_016054 [Hymenochirus boettgeri]|uniref:Uncharacterized protein n=1 Tax=Hymenochirus boettgeri TaxID=247094 RepID=A0A8T2JVF8_9PIPI|nr:hypothetical protein GDO86_016054 [Hymenochirus boettgeri]
MRYSCFKSALAVCIRRLNASERQNALQNRKGPTKGSKKDIVPLASNRKISPGTRRESSGDAKGSRNRAGSTSSSSSGKKTSER